MFFQWRSFLAGILVGALLVSGLVLYGSSLDGELRLPELVETEKPSPESALEARPLRARFEEEAPGLSARVAPEEDPAGSTTPLLKAQSSPVLETVEALENQPPDSQPDSGEKWFDANTLLALGVREDEIKRIEEVWQEYFMYRIRIQNERSRNEDKWKEAAQLNIMNATQAREALGDESFDAMLYAAGERNRVFFSQLLDDSPGMSAGLMPGDELISYDGQRIFRPREIKQLTSEGERGEWVEVQVLREGEPRRFFVLRGPIGAQLDFRSRPPYELP
jgi:hypothetical protein